MRAASKRIEKKFAVKVGAICSLAVLFATALPGGATDDRHAIAGAYARGDFSVSYGVAADVSLPEIATNRSWYANWVMLVAKRRSGKRQPFVQLGEIRGFAAHDRPTGFIAYEAPGERVVFRRLRRVPAGNHHLAISGNDRTIRLAFDQELVATLPRSEFFDQRDRVYAQYAAEVADPGDAASGSLRHLVVETDEDFAPRPLEVGCLRYDRGLRLEPSPNGLLPVGRFTPEEPSGFRDCAEAPVLARP